MSAPWVVDRVRPAGRRGVVELLRADADLPWIPVGGETGLGRGARPDRARGIATGGLGAVVEHARDDLTVTVEAGVRVGVLDALLREARQWLPCLRGLHLEGTVGGILASDRRGPWAGAFGGVRDAILGVTFVDGQGRTARGGGRVVKNVAGYDLMKLLAGSLGELGVVLEATFKVLPLPAAFGGIVVHDPDPALPRNVVRDLGGLGMPIGLWRFDLGEGERLAAVFAGSPLQIAALGARGKASWGRGARTWEGAEIDAFASRFAAWTDARKEPVGWGGALPYFLAERSPRDLLGEGTFVLDLLRGHLWWKGPMDGATLASVRAGLRDGEGHLNLDLPAEASVDFTPWGVEAPQEAKLWRGIKDALDPHRRLVVGRLPGGL